MKLIGNEGETLAVHYLKKQGYTIIARNFTTRLGEIDIIAKDGGTIVFVEVKMRTNNAFGAPFESINAAKKKKLTNAASLYLKSLKGETPARFDIISIIRHPSGSNEIHHIKDAFEG